MKKTLGSLAQIIGGSLSSSADCNRQISGFFTDSRTPKENCMFLAIKGERADGNAFVQELAAKGYACLTDCADNLCLSGDIIYAPQGTVNALQQLALNYRETDLASLPVIGITGSVGKTTTKDMVAVALSSVLNVYKTIGNSNSQIGLPQTILKAEKSYDCAVVELGMSYKGEMEKIANCARPNISIITNIGYSHIENLGTREAIRDEKLKICQYSKPASAVLLNGDEPLLRNTKIDGKICYYVSLTDTSCHCYAEEITETEEGLNFFASVFGKIVYVTLNVKGKHYVINALFALAVIHILGLNVHSAAQMLSHYQSDEKRQHIYRSNGHTVISDCYNASPESMEAALSVLSAYKGRRIAVLGDMLELGTHAKELHNRVGEFSSNKADVLITYGDSAAYIADTSEIPEKYHFSLDRKQELHQFLQGFIAPGDTVLYKASNSIRLFDIII